MLFIPEEHVLLCLLSPGQGVPLFLCHVSRCVSTDSTFCVCIYVCVCMCVWVHVHVSMHTTMHVACVCVCVCVCVSGMSVHACICVCLWVCAHVLMSKVCSPLDSALTSLQSAHHLPTVCSPPPYSVLTTSLQCAQLLMHVHLYECMLKCVQICIHMCVSVCISSVW